MLGVKPLSDESLWLTGEDTVPRWHYEYSQAAELMSDLCMYDISTSKHDRIFISA